MNSRMEHRTVLPEHTRTGSTENHLIRSPSQIGKSNRGSICFLFSILFLIPNSGVVPTVASAQEIVVDCNDTAGRLKGIYRHFSGGPALLANPQKLKPLLNQIDASFLRVWLLGQPDYFTGTSLEDARNPEKYNFTGIDRAAALAEPQP